MTSDIVIIQPDQPTELAPYVAPQSITHPVNAYLDRLESVNSKTAMLKHLNTIAAMCTNGQSNAYGFAWEHLTYEHTNKIRAMLQEPRTDENGRVLPPYSTATVNVMLAAMRGVLKQCWKLGYTNAETYHNARDVQNVKGVKLPAGRDISADELTSLVRVCADDKTPLGTRDTALIAILSKCGLRRAEAAALRIEDVDLATRKIEVKQGKGDKDRIVYCPTAAIPALKKWMAVRGESSGALFNPTTKARFRPTEQVQFDTSKGLTTVAIYKILQKRATQAGLSHLSPHDFRRSYAGDMMDSGADIVTVQKLMGHASVETTGRYDRRPEEVKKKATEGLSFPQLD